MCLVIYDGLNEETRMVVETMSIGGFLFQSPDYCWNLIKRLARDTYEWEMSLSTRLIALNPTYIIPPPYWSNCHSTSHDILSCDVILVNYFNPSPQYECDYSIQNPHLIQQYIYDDDHDDYDEGKIIKENYRDDDKFEKRINVMDVLKGKQPLVEKPSLDKSIDKSDVIHEFLSVPPIVFESHVPFLKSLTSFFLPLYYILLHSLFLPLLVTHMIMKFMYIRFLSNLSGYVKRPIILRKNC